MDSTESGIDTDSRPSHPEKADTRIDTTGASEPP